jgi:hypothetical protein
MIFALLTPLIAAQACVPDLLIDDYSRVVQRDYEGALRYFNLVEADYGHVNMTADYEQANRRVVLVPTAPDNFWFAKFNLRACFDLTGYTGIQFDVVAPAGSEAVFTLTQMAPDCVTRTLDSVYTPLTRYITPNGVRQTAFQPLSDFALNVEGGAFDMVHLKDWTMVNLAPLGARFEISNFILKGNCSAIPVQSTSTAAASTVVPAPVAPSSTPAGTMPVKAGAETVTGILSSLAAVALSLFA